MPEEVQKGLRKLSTNHRKTAYLLAKSVARLCKTYGVERVGFFTPTFADHVTCAREAGRRFNSLRSNVLAQRYAESICVLERMKSGRIHFHLLVVLPEDIRTGFDFEAAERGVYTSANACLRAEWAFWRKAAPLYGFGRTELLPVKSNEDGISKYVGKYIAKHVGAREIRDKGVRLVRYSRGARVGSNAFQFVSPRSRLWRWQVGEFAKRHGCAEFAQLAEKFGPKWAYFRRAEIMALEPPGELWEIWHADRVEMANHLARGTGATQAEAFAHLFQEHLAKSLAFEVPKWSGVRVPRDDFECGPEAVERTVIWADGVAERIEIVDTIETPF